MENQKPPAVAWAAGAVLGAAVASSVEAASSWWLALFLLSLGLILTRRWARALAGFALGALVLSLAPPPAALEEVDGERPVEAVILLLDTPWLDSSGQRRGRSRLIELRQGERSWRLDRPIYVRAPGEGTGWIARGMRLKVRGYWGRAPVTRNLRPSHPGPWRLAIPSARFVELEEAAPAWIRAVDRRRGALAGTLATWRDQDAAALVSTLWLGERTNLPERWQRALRAWGLAHLTAVSGLHVGVVALLLWGLTSLGGLALSLLGWTDARLCRYGRYPRLLVILGGIGFYALLVGPRPSVIRATLMAAVALTALILRRPPAALNALAVAVTVMIAIDPTVILELGFQLSAAATAGLLLWTLPIARTLARDGNPGPFVLGLSSSLAAQLAVLPWTAPSFALIHPASPLIQLLALPWLMAALIGGGLMLALSSFWPSIWSAVDGRWGLDVVNAPLELLAGLEPGAWSGWPISLGFAGALCWLVFLLAGLWVSRTRFPGPQHRRRWIPTCLAGAWLITAMIVLARYPGAPGGMETGGEAEIVALDVGQGDALLLRSAPFPGNPQGATILVDAGGWRRGDSASRILVPTLADLGIRRLDAVILSHPDTDHCGGLLDLSSYLPIGEIWSAPGWEEKCAGLLIGRRGPRLRALWRGRPARKGAWTFETLWPPAGERSGGRGRGNARSLVLLAEAAGVRVLLTGDIDAGVEVEISRHIVEPGAVGSGAAIDILKVPHHGSKTSTSRGLLDAVTPRMALIQAGRGNSYGHPHPSVLRRLGDRRSQILRTDRHGLIRLQWRRGQPIRRSVVAGTP